MIMIRIRVHDGGLSELDIWKNDALSVYPRPAANEIYLCRSVRRLRVCKEDHGFEMRRRVRSRSYLRRRPVVRTLDRFAGFDLLALGFFSGEDMYHMLPKASLTPARRSPYG